jgi:hypothetical protein
VTTVDDSDRGKSCHRGDQRKKESIPCCQREVGHSSSHRKLTEDFGTAKVACPTKPELHEASNTMLNNDPFAIGASEESCLLKSPCLL